MKPISYHYGARREIDRAYVRYLTESQQAAEGFLEELIPAVDRIQLQPGLYPRHHCRTQRLVLDRYPFSIAFRERLHDIQIIAVAHAKRRPGYWTKRLKQ